ncbi:recombinase family protein [Proteus faecis]|uniref:recombinase family protein n=1 Tax=Proteus faecis TaxID=2050967 RepID=UPI0018C4D5C8|nr:recombinase family protein [Proteus mirabilis]
MLCYSYVRFSTPEQARGDSHRRQMEFAQNYCKLNNLTLVEDLSFNDFGISAYKGDNLKNGALGKFLELVHSGYIPNGSTLIIESFDRLSRQTAIKAQAIFSEIISAGITIVTAMDNRSYNLKSVTENPFDLMYSLMIMIRANEESETKSKRVKEAIKANIRNKKIVSSKLPYWIKHNKEKDILELIPERVEVILYIIEKYLSGLGISKLTQHLNDNIKPFAGKNWYPVYLQKLLRSPSLYGERQYNIDNTLHIMDNYYPAIINKSKFAVIQENLDLRAPTRGGKISSAITGIRKAYCGYCYGVLVSQSTRRNGKIVDGLRRVRCNSNHNGKHCITSTFRASLVEHAIAEYCSQHIDLSFLEPTSNASKLKLSEYKLELHELNKKINNYVKFISEGHVSPAIVASLNEAENRKKEIEYNINKLDLDILSDNKEELIKKWREIKTNLESYNEENILKLRELIRISIKTIYVFQYGVWGKENSIILPSRKSIPIEKGAFTIQITFKSGVRKTLVLGDKIEDMEVIPQNRTIKENGKTYTSEEYTKILEDKIKIEYEQK